MRFVQLTKENHPDLNAANAKAATARMVELTEAYTCLKKLIEHGVQHQRAAAAGRRRTPGAAGDGAERDAASRSPVEEEEQWSSVAATFRAPGASLSLRGFTLPWQRASTSAAASSLEAKMREPHVSFSDFAQHARRLAREQRRREERIRNDAAAADGTHGFTAAYFDKAQRRSAALRGGATPGVPSTGFAALAVFYYARRLRWAVARAPRTAWHAIRHVLLGR